jgi:CTP:molybdopterin cytidylyltransferase MocA
MPNLSPAIIARLVDEHAATEIKSILVPTIRGKHGHPVLFPWSLAEQVFQLAADEGVKALLTRNRVREVVCDDIAEHEPFADVDTPVDYQRLREAT